MIPPEPQNFGFKFPASGSVPVLFSSMHYSHCARRFMNAKTNVQKFTEFAVWDFSRPQLSVLIYLRLLIGSAPKGKQMR